MVILRMVVVEEGLRVATVQFLMALQPQAVLNPLVETVGLLQYIKFLAPAQTVVWDTAVLRAPAAQTTVVEALATTEEAARVGAPLVVADPVTRVELL